MKIAAHMWAWEHSCRVHVDRFPFEDGQIVRVTLVSKFRERDFQ